jgi:O-antigen/teichoic acid export membrane protein
MQARLNHPAAALVLRIIAAGLSFVFGIVAARLLDGFGLVSVLLGIVNVGVVFSLLGHETLATREVAALWRPDSASANAAAVIYSRTAAKQVWLAGIVVLGALFLIVSFLPVGRQAGVKYLPLLLLIPLIARTRLSQGLIRGAHRASLSLVADGIVRPGLALIALFALLYANSDIGSGFAAIMIACAVVGLLVGRAWEQRALAALPRSAADGSASRVVASVRRHFSAPIFASSVLAVLVSQIALISTGLLTTSTDAGLYAAAERFSLAAALIGQAVYLAVASRFAALHASGDTERLCALIRKVTRSVSGATVLVCLVLGLAAGPLLGLYGHSFGGAIPVLQVLLVSVLCNACAGPTGQVLLMTKHEGDHLTAMFCSLLVQSALIIALVPEYGVLGAAWAVLISTILWNGIMMYFVRSRLSINPFLAWA